MDSRARDLHQTIVSRNDDGSVTIRYQSNKPRRVQNACRESDLNENPPASHNGSSYQRSITATTPSSSPAYQRPPPTPRITNINITPPIPRKSPYATPLKDTSGRSFRISKSQDGSIATDFSRWNVSVFDPNDISKQAEECARYKKAKREAEVLDRDDVPVCVQNGMATHSAKPRKEFACWSDGNRNTDESNFSNILDNNCRIYTAKDFLIEQNNASCRSDTNRRTDTACPLPYQRKHSGSSDRDYYGRSIRLNDNDNGSCPYPRESQPNEAKNVRQGEVEPYSSRGPFQHASPQPIPSTDSRNWKVEPYQPEDERCWLNRNQLVKPGTDNSRLQFSDRSNWKVEPYQPEDASCSLNRNQPTDTRNWKVKPYQPEDERCTLNRNQAVKSGVENSRTQFPNRSNLKVEPYQSTDTSCSLNRNQATKADARNWKLEPYQSKDPRSTLNRAQAIKAEMENTVDALATVADALDKSWKLANIVDLPDDPRERNRVAAERLLNHDDALAEIRDGLLRILYVIGTVSHSTEQTINELHSTGFDTLRAGDQRSVNNVPSLGLSNIDPYQVSRVRDDIVNVLQRFDSFVTNNSQRSELNSIRERLQTLPSMQSSPSSLQSTSRTNESFTPSFHPLVNPNSQLDDDRIEDITEAIMHLDTILNEYRGFIDKENYEAIDQIRSELANILLTEANINTSDNAPITNRDNVRHLEEEKNRLDKLLSEYRQLLSEDYYQTIDDIRADLAKIKLNRIDSKPDAEKAVVENISNSKTEKDSKAAEIHLKLLEEAKNRLDNLLLEYRQFLNEKQHPTIDKIRVNLADTIFPVPGKINDGNKTNDANKADNVPFKENENVKETKEIAAIEINRAV